jgi:hypothetical protein
MPFEKMLRSISMPTDARHCRNQSSADRRSGALLNSDFADKRGLSFNKRSTGSFMLVASARWQT